MKLDNIQEEINFNDLIKSDNLYSLCIPFFNLIHDNDSYFIIKSEYRSSKFNSNFNKDIYLKNNEILINTSELPFILKDKKHYCFIKKTQEIKTPESFLYALYKKIQGLREKYDDENFSSIILLSAFVPRGSMDIEKGNKFAVDIFRKYETKEYLNQWYSLLTSTINDIRQLNLNFRELQPDFLNEKAKRNTQFRINLKWFCNYFLEDVKNLNIYKYETLKKNLSIINKHNINEKIKKLPDQKLKLYIEEITEGKEYLKNTDTLRQLFGFDYKKRIDNNRDYTIVKIAKEILPDVCSGCINKYDLKYRTFKYKNSTKWYLEINHVIAFANNNVDQFDNLCKLCPPCHKALTKNRADEELQRMIIKSIIENNFNVSNFIKLFIETDSLEEKINYVFSKLL